MAGMQVQERSGRTLDSDIDLADIASTNHHIIGYFDAETRADYRDGFGIGVLMITRT